MGKSCQGVCYICNQSAGFNRCITKIQDSVQEQLRVLQAELGKGKSSAKAQSALDELHYLTSFNQNVSFAMGKSLQHRYDFTFTQMANLTLVRRDSYFEDLKQGVKPDTFSSLRNCLLNGYALFPDAVTRKAEDEIAQYESAKRTSQVQVVSTRQNHSDGVVPSSGLQHPGSDLAPSTGGHVCNEVQLQTSPIRVSSTGPRCLGSGCSDSLLGKTWTCMLFPPVSLLGKVVSKLSDHLYRRVILIAPGWPNMPWFWDLVELSSQIPLCLPNHPDLVTQPFNRAHHRNLTNLNLHAWLLELKQCFSSPVASQIEAPQRS